MDVFAIYTSLWERATQLGVNVRYEGFMSDGEGVFYPDPYDRGEPQPTIEIGRPHYEESSVPSRVRNAGGQHLPPPDILRDVITLAHELGHYLSWSGHTPRSVWDSYFAAAKRRDEAWDAVSPELSGNERNDAVRAAAKSALTHEEMQRILEEEQRAWDFGRQVLEEHGFEDFERYAACALRGLHFHRYRLGIDELWDDDVLPG